MEHTFYMGSTGGGIWKTTDGGERWINVSDGFFEAGSMGSVAVAESDPNIIYAGTGSSAIRGNVSAGVGMYKSTDAGATWQHIGIRDGGQIGDLQIHPANPDIVYAAVLGHAFGPNDERKSWNLVSGGEESGLFTTVDGGDTWTKLGGGLPGPLDSVRPRGISFDTGPHLGGHRRRPSARSVPAITGRLMRLLHAMSSFEPCSTISWPGSLKCSRTT